MENIYIYEHRKQTFFSYIMGDSLQKILKKNT